MSREIDPGGSICLRRGREGTMPEVGVQFFLNKALDAFMKSVEINKGLKVGIKNARKMVGFDVQLTGATADMAKVLAGNVSTDIAYTKCKNDILKQTYVLTIAINKNFLDPE